jgi:hypothetical protein
MCSADRFWWHIPSRDEPLRRTPPRLTWTGMTAACGRDDTGTSDGYSERAHSGPGSPGGAGEPAGRAAGAAWATIKAAARTPKRPGADYGPSAIIWRGSLVINDLPAPTGRRIALIAHDNMKQDMLEWAEQNLALLTGISCSRRPPLAGC